MLENQPWQNMEHLKKENVPSLKFFVISIRKISLVRIYLCEAFILMINCVKIVRHAEQETWRCMLIKLIMVCESVSWAGNTLMQKQIDAIRLLEYCITCTAVLYCITIFQYCSVMHYNLKIWKVMQNCITFLKKLQYKVCITFSAFET